MSRRQCTNEHDSFCYICGKYTLLANRCDITDFVKKVYLAYFEIHIGDQDKHWVPHKVCLSCVKSLDQGEQKRFIIWDPYGVESPEESSR